MLLIEGEPFPPTETAGYFLDEATEAELAELRRGGYTLLHVVGGAATTSARSPTVHRVN